MDVKSINLVQITTHDSGRHFGCYGHPTLHTPAIDGLAEDGVRLTNLFCPVPICSPSRTSMLTGLYPQEHGQLDLTGFGWKLQNPAWHMSNRLRAAGYHTALFGTQHEILPADLDALGFDHVTLHTPGENAVGLADKVSEYLQTQHKNDKPFYLQIGFRETHTPFVANGAEPDMENGVEVPPYLVDDEGNRQRMAEFQGAVRMADQGAGRILKGLKASGLEQNTLVVVTTDHGIEMPRAKWHLYDPGITVAMILRCPALGLVGGKTYDELASHVDYLPSIFQWLNLPAPDVTGQSFAGAISNGNHPRDAVFAMYSKRSQPRGIRTKRYKLIRHFAAAGGHKNPVASGSEMSRSIVKPVELYDLKEDPNEFENRADTQAYQKIQSDLDNRLWRWMESVHDPLLAGPIATPNYKKALSDYHQWKTSHP